MISEKTLNVLFKHYDEERYAHSVWKNYSPNIKKSRAYGGRVRSVITKALKKIILDKSSMAEKISEEEILNTAKDIIIEILQKLKIKRQDKPHKASTQYAYDFTDTKYIELYNAISKTLIYLHEDKSGCCKKEN